MMNNYLGNYTNTFGQNMAYGWMATLAIPLAIWSLVWMGFALWKAAKNNSKVWFVILLLVHTLGILDILYIFVFSKMGKKSSKKSK